MVSPAVKSDQFFGAQSCILTPYQSPSPEKARPTNVIAEVFLMSLVLTLTNLKLVALIAAGIPVIAGVAWLNVRSRAEETAAPTAEQTKDLRRWFGPLQGPWPLPLGLGQHVSGRPSAQKAEAKVANGGISSLDAIKHDRFAEQWAYVQARFAESPEWAVVEADDLVSFLMKTRGYAGHGFDQGVNYIAVGRSRLVQDYRSAYEVAARVGKGRVATQELKAAMIHYSLLFDELVQAPPVERSEVA